MIALFLGSFSTARCQQPLCCKCSSRRSSRHCSTSQTLIPPIHGPTGKFPIYRWCPRFSSVSFSGSSTASCQRQTSCHVCGSYIGHTTPSIEKAVLKVLTDILYAVDDGDLSVLALLDLSAAFDTVDHNILLTRLKVSFDITDANLVTASCRYTAHKYFCDRLKTDENRSCDLSLIHI